LQRTGYKERKGREGKGRGGGNMFATAVRYFAKRSKPKMKPVETRLPVEQALTISTAVFDVIKAHGPLTVAGTWDRVKEAGIKGLDSKTHLKIILRWMKERQRVKQICNHVGHSKQFLYVTWFTKPGSIIGELSKQAAAKAKTSKPGSIIGEPSKRAVKAKPIFPVLKEPGAEAS
jgi:hypothetical protein